MKDLYNISDWDNVNEPLKIGEILIEAGKINLIHLSMALDAQKFQEHLPLGEIFLLMKVINASDLAQALNIQHQIRMRLGLCD